MAEVQVRCSEVCDAADETRADFVAGSGAGDGREGGRIDSEESAAKECPRSIKKRPETLSNNKEED